jgi:LuxR family transcriptional regulator, quorum-sensing system regulator BjaR1
VSRALLDRTLEFVTLVDAAQSPAEIAAIVLKCAAPYGFERVFAGTIPAVGERAAQRRNHIILDHWPQSWIARYSSRGYLSVDPTIRRVRAGAPAFYWDDLIETRDDLAAQRVMDEAADFGLRQGLTVALLTLDGPAVGFSLSGGQIEHNPRLKGMMTLVASYALGQCFGRDKAAPAGPSGLTNREIDVLRWLAEGKSDRDIGQILLISEHTVDKHLRSAFAKLGAANRASAVAKAIRARIII